MTISRSLAPAKALGDTPVITLSNMTSLETRESDMKIRAKWLLVIPLVLVASGCATFLLHDRPQVDSREYKLILRTALFAERDEGVESFVNELVELDKDFPELDVKRKGEFKFKEKVVVYLDTEKHALANAMYILRKRTKGGGKKPKLTLKYRAKDYESAANADVSSTRKNELKLEEDVCAPGTTRIYSHSNKVKLKKKEPISSVTNAVAIFEGLAALGLDPTSPLEPVGEFRAWQKDGEIATFEFPGEFPGDVAAKAELTFWYDDSTASKHPNQLLTAEFSYRFECDDSSESRKGTRQFDALFLTIQTRLARWIDPDGKTKTQIAYTYGQQRTESERTDR